MGEDQPSVVCWTSPPCQPPNADQVEGEILKVAVAKEWTYAENRYISGKVVESYIDGAILTPVPLRLHEQDEWDPAEEFAPAWEAELRAARRRKPSDSGVARHPQRRELQDAKVEPAPHWVINTIRSGKRTAYEMEQILPYQVIPGGSPDDPDSDPIIYAVEHFHGGDTETAFNVLQRCLQADTRCVDAYVHLGNFRVADMKSTWWVRQGIKCYQAAVAVGERALPSDFDGVLPWSMVDNRPFLRGLHGLGVCMWNLWDAASARSVFQRLLRLNPDDNQGIRFLLDALDSGMSHLEYCRREEERGW